MHLMLLKLSLPDTACFALLAGSFCVSFFAALYWSFSAPTFLGGLLRLMAGAMGVGVLLLAEVLVLLTLNFVDEVDKLDQEPPDGNSDSFFGLVMTDKSRTFAARFGKGAAGGNQLPTTSSYEKPRDCRV